MNRDHLLELRILTGTHAGARVLLPESSQVVGSAPECDLIVSDEGVHPRHARLSAQPDGSISLEWLTDAHDPLTLAAGQGIWLGPVQMSIEQADTPWRTEVPLLSAPHETAADSLAASDAADADSQASGLSQAQASTPSTSRRKAVLAGAATLLVASVLAMGPWWWNRASPEPVQATAPVLPVATLSREQIADVVQRLAMTDHVRIETDAGRGPVVHASFLPDEQAEALATALSRLSPRPGMRLVSQEDVQMAVSDVLQRHTGPDAASLKARYLGNGRFRVDGRVADAAERRALLARLAEAAPDARGFESALLTEAESATAMLDDLRALGIDQVAGSWSDGVLQLKVRLEASEVPRWERALMAAATRHNVPFRAILDLPPPRLAKLEPLPPAPAVRSIVGGPQPYVMLADGNKLMVDGRTEHWRLVHIAAREVVFETSQGRQLTLER